MWLLQGLNSEEKSEEKSKVMCKHCDTIHKTNAHSYCVKVTCTYCGITGHSQKFCYKFDKQMKSCFLRNGKNHLLNDCSKDVLIVQMYIILKNVQSNLP